MCLECVLCLKNVCVCVYVSMYLVFFGVCGAKSHMGVFYFNTYELVHLRSTKGLSGNKLAVHVALAAHGPE